MCYSFYLLYRLDVASPVVYVNLLLRGFRSVQPPTMHARNETSFCRSRYSRDFLDVPLLGTGINGYRILRIDRRNSPFCTHFFYPVRLFAEDIPTPFLSGSRTGPRIDRRTATDPKIVSYHFHCTRTSLLPTKSRVSSTLNFFLNRSIFCVSLIPFASAPFVAAVELTRIPLFTMNPFKSKKRR